MGWDAYANVKMSHDSEEITNDFQKKIFRNAYLNIKRHYKGEFCNSILNGRVEGWEVSIMLAEAVNHLYVKNNSVLDRWSAEDVRYLNKHAEWFRCEVNDENEDAFYIAKYFLRACALAGLSITFSY